VILTVTLNAAIDRTVAVPNFRLGRRHRAVESRTVAGGKGINVARALALLGRPVIATGFVGGPSGTRVLEQLHEESVLTDFIEIAAETRINLAVIDPTSGEQTEINERGPGVSAEETKRLFDRIGYLAGGAKICVLAGSLPPGAGDDLYARLIDDLRRRGVPVVLDAEGEAMLAGVRAGAAMVTPNETEAEELVGQEFADGSDLASGLLEIVRLGAEQAAITRPEGASRRSARVPSGACSRSTPRRWSRSRRSARATRSSLATSLPGTKGAARRSASPTGSPAGRSRPSTSAPASSIATRSSDCWAGSPCTIWRSRPKCRLVSSTPALEVTLWKSKSAAERKGDALTDSTT